MSELFHVAELQYFLSSSKFCIEKELKVDEINIEVINLTKFNLVEYGSKVYRIKKFGIQSILCWGRGNYHSVGLSMPQSALG